MPRKRTQPFIFAILPALLLSAAAFKQRDEPSLKWPREFLNAAFDIQAEMPKLKKFDLQLTDDGFFRLKKTFLNGKQEYFSFNLRRLEDVDYLGSTSYGVLLLKTVKPDIIVQTYNDRTGNIDTMASVLQVPVKSIEPEGLDSLQSILMRFKL